MLKAETAFLVFVVSCIFSSSAECNWLPLSNGHQMLHRQVASIDCHLEPSLIIQEKTSIPHHQGWSHCRYCGFMNGTVKPNSPPFSPDAVDLSWSQWNDFFLVRNDRFRTTVTNHLKVTAGSILISTPIFILPLICFHPGHLLVDLMEQVYASMIEIYGEVRLDSILVLDVSFLDDRQVLPHIIDTYVNSLDQAFFGYMIHWLTHAQVFSIKDFTSQMETISTSKMVIFKDIHFGGDISSTFMHLGTPHNPCQFLLSDSSLEPFSRNYKRFHKFILSRVNEMINDPIDTQPVIDILFIYRNSSRSVLNMKELMDIASAMNLRWLAVDFAVTPFRTQLTYLRKTRLLVAAAGTALHNLIFMNHSTSAIVIMMPEWCHCSWQYVNQGILLGMNVLTYCPSKGTENQVHLLHWTSNFWLQCSAVQKMSDVFVDTERFAFDLSQIFRSSQHENIPPPLVPLISKPIHDSSWCQIGQRPSADPPQRIVSPEFLLSDLVTTYDSIGFWRLKFIGELSFPLIPQNMLRSFPSLSVCNFIQFGSGSGSGSGSQTTSPETYLICFLVDDQNYRAWFEIRTPYPSLTIHSFGQLSSQGGKLRDSDSYLSLDLRVRSRINRIFPQIELRIGNGFDCLSSNFNQLVCSTQGIEVQLCIVNVTPLDSSFEISLQSIVKRLCSLHNLTTSCPSFSSSLAHCIHKRILETHLSLPHPQYLPTPEKPFVFLHIEKTAGTSIRKLAYLASLRKSLRPVIPGAGDLHPVIFDLHGFDRDYLKDVSVLAGHFSWDIWSQLPSVYQPPAAAPLAAAPQATPPCFVMGRHPVDRVVSYFYQRCYREPECIHANLPFNNLTTADLSFFISTFRQVLLSEKGEYRVVDEGVQDAGCRAMANKKATTGRSIHETSLPTELTEREEELALKNVESCVVGMQEDWINTKKMIDHWFPWIKTGYPKEEKLFQGTERKESMETIRPDLRAVVEKMNRCDMRLHEKMKSLFEKQLSVIETDAYL